MRMTSLARAFALAALTSLNCWGVSAQERPLRIAVIDDMSGLFSSNGGPNTLLATNMAVEDFGGKVLGRKIEVLSADHQNKPDIASALAGRLVDEQGVRAIVVGGASSAGLAIQTVARQRNVPTLVSGGYAPNFSTDQCSPFGTQWAPSTDALSKAVARGLVEAGGKKWFFITADYVFGHALAADAAKAVKEAGGTVVGEVKHPLNTPDMSSQLLQAQASGADVIGLANAGPDLVATIKQTREFGIGPKLAAMLVFEPNVLALGLDAAQGMKFPVPFYWDFNDETRAWAKRFTARNGNVLPTMGHALAYVATTHYLRAVEKAGSDDAAAVAKAMREIPIGGNMIQKARMQPNGRVVMDMFVVEVKSPKESKGPADLYKVLDSLPGETLFTPAEKSGCPHLAAR